MIEVKKLNWQKDFECIYQRACDWSPFKIDGFFRPEEIGFSSFSEFVEKFGHQKVQINEFTNLMMYNSFCDGKKLKSKTTHSIEDFIKLASINPESLKNLRCIENYLPPHLVPVFSDKLPSKLAQVNARPDFGIGHYYRFFLGLKGQETDPHYDWVNFGNFLIQISGKKTVYLVSPYEFHHLPFFSHYMLYSNADLLQMAREKGLNVVEIELLEGEGLYIPPYYLHGMIYPEDSISVSLRCFPYLRYERVHSRLPANSSLTHCLWKWKMCGEEDKLKELGKMKNYMEAIELFSQLTPCPLSSTSVSLKFEEEIFYHLNSFEGQWGLKAKKHSLLKHGAAQFD